MNVTYENQQIEKLCNRKEEMEKFFSHDKTLVNNLQTLMGLFDVFKNINEFYKPYFRGYNLEKVEGTENKYSIRIIPKMRKSSYRMYLESSEKGVKITIIKIDKHTYKL